MSNVPPTPCGRFRKRHKMTARDRCEAIVDVMRLTHEHAQKDSLVVCISRDMWDRIYFNAQEGAK